MEFKIFGCKVNKYYTDKWINSTQLSGKTGIFIASCVVTDKAKKKWVKFVRDTITSGKITGEKKVYISGCGAFKSGKAQSDFFQIYPDLEQFKDIIVILGENPDSLEIDQTHSNLKPFPTPPLQGEGANKNKSSREVSNKLTPPPSGTPFQKGEKKEYPKIAKLKNLTGIYTKKFVLIQGGCDSFCTFCLTVQKRGRHFFRSADDIVEEILEFELTGGKEVVLTGVNLSAWGLDTTNPPKSHSQLRPHPQPLSLEGEGSFSRFAELLTIILEKTDIGRIRISSLGPEFITDECLEIFKNTRIYPHFHYSVQSLSTSVLADMKRHYDGEYMKKLLLKTKKLQRDDGIDISLGADIIVGFPGETDENFTETLNAVKEIGIQKIHAFPFSAHEMGESVPAGFFKNQIDQSIKKERMKQITEVGDTIREDFIKSQIGKPLEVLVEIVGENKFKGWTQNYIEATEKNFKIHSGEVKKNSILKGELF